MRLIMRFSCCEFLNCSYITYSLVLTEGVLLATFKRNVFFHITANADWSNLPLTGTFVEILDRIINL